jgi:hypothetical protein
MWFSELAVVENPGPHELLRFVEATTDFMDFVLESWEFAFLWDDDQSLAALARETFNSDVRRAAGALAEAIPNINQDVLRMHGLIGSPMRFKLRVMDSIGRQWERVRGKFTMREWFTRIIDAIDAALDSLIAAAGGVGSLIKEFKDALRALAKIVP